nr:hypothetical protein [Tanacetum cinerariifolium]
MIGGNGENQFRQYAGQNAGNLNGYNDIQNVGNQVAQNPRIQNQIGNANLLAVPEEYDLMTAAADLDEIEEVNANCILIANLQQASSSVEVGKVNSVNRKLKETKVDLTTELA